MIYNFFFFLWVAFTRFFSLFVCLFLLFKATPVACGSSQVRGPIGATAAGLPHSNVESELHLWPALQLTAAPDRWPIDWGQGLNLHPHGYWLDSFLLCHKANSCTFLMMSFEAQSLSPGYFFFFLLVMKLLLSYLRNHCLIEGHENLCLFFFLRVQ